ncbi:MAG: hypothetical protein JWQ04_1987 [Pedosphaera sp.]|nr:hypothetical protein [Pedosphaera sp.]
MNDEGTEAGNNKEITCTDYRPKLIEARERKGLTIHEAAELMDYPYSGSGYYDIELCEGELNQCYSLQEVKSICEKFDIHPRGLFCDQAFARISLSEVIAKIKKHCAEKQLSIGEFEGIVGWQVESCLTDPAKALLDWNIDCLMDVCREVGIDWRCVVADL